MKRRGYFFCCFSLKSVKMNGLSVGEFLFGMPIWADSLILLEGDVPGQDGRCGYIVGRGGC